MRHEHADQHIANPHFVRARRLEAAEGAWLTSQSGTLQTAALEMLANGELGDADAMASEQDGANLGR